MHENKIEKEPIQLQFFTINPTEDEAKIMHPSSYFDSKNNEIPRFVIERTMDSLFAYARRKEIASVDDVPPFGPLTAAEVARYFP